MPGKVTIYKAKIELQIIYIDQLAKSTKNITKRVVKRAPLPTMAESITDRMLVPSVTGNNCRKMTTITSRKGKSGAMDW